MLLKHVKCLIFNLVWIFNFREERREKSSQKLCLKALYEGIQFRLSKDCHSETLSLRCVFALKVRHSISSRNRNFAAQQSIQNIVYSSCRRSDLSYFSTTILTTNIKEIMALTVKYTNMSGKVSIEGLNTVFMASQ